MNEYEQRLAALNARYAESLPQKRAALADGWQALLDEPESLSACRALQQLAHRLSGSAPGYGFDRLGQAAAALDTLTSEYLGVAADRRVVGAALVAMLRPLVEILSQELTLARRSGVSEPVSVNVAGRPRLILVEDDPEQSELNTRQLQARGFEVLTAHSSEELWMLLGKHSADLVVLDYWLAGETAIDIVTRLKREPAYAALLVVCLTREANPALLRALMLAGCSLVLNKAERSEDVALRLYSCMAARYASSD
jgi:CheY-like chemotaxis protein